MFSADEEQEQIRRAWAQKGKQQREAIARRLKLMTGAIVVLLAVAGCRRRVSRSQVAGADMIMPSSRCPHCKSPDCPQCWGSKRPRRSFAAGPSSLPATRVPATFCSLANSVHETA